MKIILILFCIIIPSIVANISLAQEGIYKFGKEIYVIEEVSEKFIIRREESSSCWKLTRPYDVDEKIGVDAINSGGIVEFC